MSKQKLSCATKLDAGKRKLSLIYPTMLFLLMPPVAGPAEHVNSAVRALSFAAHANDEAELVSNLESSVDALKRYAGGWCEAAEQLAMAMEYGAAKPEYGRNNWKKGMEWSRYLDAAMRHGFKIISGELNDKDSGNTHLAHMLGSIHMLIGNIDLGIGINDLF